MDRTAMLRWLVPGLLAGGLIVLLGLLISLSDFGTDDPTASTRPSGGNPVAGGTSTAGGDATGMSEPTASGLPSIDADEWKSGPGGLKIWDVVEGEGGCRP